MTDIEAVLSTASLGSADETGLELAFSMTVLE